MVEEGGQGPHGQQPRQVLQQHEPIFASPGMQLSSSCVQPRACGCSVAAVCEF